MVISPATLPAATADSPVADAAMRSDREAVRALLRQGADVNVPQPDGMTALHWAALHGDAELVEMLVYAGAWPDVGTRLGGYTPLHLAAREPRPAAVAALLRAGADVEARTASGGALPLHFAAATGDVETIELLLAAGARVDATDEAWEQTPMMFAAAGEQLAAVRALIEGGADLSVSSKVFDVAALYEADRDAARLRDRQKAAMLELAQEAAREGEEGGEEGEGEEGEEVAGGEEGEEAAEGEEGAEGEEAAGEGEKEAVGEEVAAGEEGATGEEVPEGEEKAEGEPTTEAQEKAAGEKGEAEEGEGEEGEGEEGEGEEGEGEDDEPEEEKRPPTYGELVGEHGGLTALLYAAREGHVDTVTALLDAGADIDQPSASDHTSPLLIATLNGHFDLAMMLLARGADPDLASDAGATPLYGALNVRWAPRSAYPQQNAYKQQQTDYLELMTALLDAGADPNVRLTRHLWYTSFNFDHLLDSTGATPFWRAAYATDIEAMRLLVARGADPNIPTSKLPSRGRPRPQGEDGEEEEEDPSGLPDVPVGGPAVSPLHAASGAGYGEGFAGYAHQHVPDGWLPAVRYLVEELGADVNARDHNGYNAVHHAAARGDFDMILYLVARGADPTAISRKGQTTADMANGPVQRIQPYPRAVWLLERLGSKNNDNCVSC
jgi:ankyrin repeat protein